MTVERAIKILNPEHREHYDGLEEVNEACRSNLGGKENDMKYFISQGMAGRTDADIKAEREKVIATMKKENPDAEFIDSFFEGFTGEKPLWYLGKSLELLSTADMCIFVDGAECRARGCWMEYQACLRYGIDSCSFDTNTGTFTAYGH